MLREPEGSTRPNMLYTENAKGKSRHPVFSKSYHPSMQRSQLRIRLPKSAQARRIHFYRQGRTFLSVAILVSGGVVPGTNAVIDAIVREQWRYAKAHGGEAGLRVYGLQKGFQAFDNYHSSYYLLTPCERRFERELVTGEFTKGGGSILGTSRVDSLRDPTERPKKLSAIVRMLRNELIDVLYVIGGDGSMKAAHALWSSSLLGREERPLTVIGIPQLLTNDILWVSPSLGCLSAATEAAKMLQQLSSEVRSNPRIGVVQLLGAASGFMVCQAVNSLETGTCDAILIPEVPFTIGQLSKHIAERVRSHRVTSPHALVVMAEGAVPVDILPLLDQYELPFEGQRAAQEYAAIRQKMRVITSWIDDHLRSTTLSMVSDGLRSQLVSLIRGGASLRVFTNEPRHLLRAMAPSEEDVRLAQRLGKFAVDTAMAGYTDVMVANWNNDIFVVPLQFTSLGVKQLNTSEALYKSVVAKIGRWASIDTARPTTQM